MPQSQGFYFFPLSPVGENLFQKCPFLQMYFWSHMLTPTLKENKKTTHFIAFTRKKALYSRNKDKLKRIPISELNQETYWIPKHKPLPCPTTNSALIFSVLVILMFWYDSFLEDSTKITLTSPSSSCVNDLLNQNVPFHQSSHWAKDIRIWVQGCSGDWNLWFKIYQRKKSCKEVPGIYTGILPWICNRMSLCIHKVPLHNVTGVLSEILEVVH